MDLSNVPTYHAGIAQSKAHRALRALTTRLLKKHKLGMLQWFILGLIHDAGKPGVRIGDLAEQLDTTMAFITNHVNGLEARGLVRRQVDPADTRARLVVLEPKAKQQVAKIEAELRADMRTSVYSLITPVELQTYVKVLTKFAEIDG